MSRDPEQGPRWLDRLARWSVPDRVRSRDEAAKVAVVAGGSTRRTALRRAAGTAGALALAGPLSLTDPPLAAARSPLSLCVLESFKGVYEDFQKCVKSPLEELENATELLRIYESGPPSKHPKQAKKVLARFRRVRDKAIKDIEFCNTLFNLERSEGELKCQTLHKPNQPPPGSEGGKMTPGCERGFTLCVDYCCNDANAYCQGCETPTCCRLDADCCPGQH